MTFCHNLLTTCHWLLMVPGTEVIDMSMSDFKQSLLIVDDDQSNLDSLERIFQREQVEVHTAANGADALTILRQQRISV